MMKNPHAIPGVGVSEAAIRADAGAGRAGKLMKEADEQGVLRHNTIVVRNCSYCSSEVPHAKVAEQDAVLDPGLESTGMPDG